MLKALATDDATGEHLYLFGLSHKNLELLKKGRPIEINLTEMHTALKGTVVIFSGKTEEDMATILSQFMRGPTPIHVSTKDQDNDHG